MIAILLAALALAPVVAHADACVTDRMKVESARGLDIPIPDLGTISSPALVLSNSAQLEVHEVVVAIDIEHSFSGDVIVTLIHTPDNGPPNTTATLLNRAGGEWFCQEPLVSGGDYQFGDSSREWFCGLVPVDEICVDPASGTLQVFDGIRGGEGTWWLSIQDVAPQDSGIFHGWALYVIMGPIVSVDDDTWGSVKARYRP